MAIKIKKIKKLDNPEFTVDIEVNKTHSYQLSNGWVSHNTVSQLTNAASGIHPRHNKYYLRRVREDKTNPAGKLMVASGIPYEDDVSKPNHTWVFTFPMKTENGSVCRNDLSAIEHLELWKLYQLYWCEHKPSVTISVREHEWMEVGAWVYKNFEFMSGVSFLPHSEHIYKQAPYEDITEEEYNKWLEKMPKEIDWNRLQEYELEDQTTSSREFACVAGGCEI